MPLFSATDPGVSLAAGDKVAILDGEDLPNGGSTSAFTFTTQSPSGITLTAINLCDQDVELEVSADNVNWADTGQPVSASSYGGADIGEGFYFRLTNLSGSDITNGTIWIAI